MFQIIRRLNVNGKQPLSPRCSSQPTSLKCTDRKGLGLPTSDFRLPTSDFRLPTSDFRLPTSDFLLLTSDFRLKISYFKPQADLTKCKDRISDF
ncbi:unnamed protein product [Porites evermanni]|uniref:Uncharacterized protein n=1 Tax=Porites evermanni TaxID=104178 RepID=A0ABN8QWD3_9CNID|nr:unnamed protein product [Porites evermanni]